MPQSQKTSEKVIFVSSETTAFTAYPKVRSRYCFRSTRNCLFDNMVYPEDMAENKSKELGLAKWYTIASGLRLR